MIAQLIGVGRNKVTKTVEVKNESALRKEVGKHLRSKGWDLEDVVGVPGHFVVVAGVRSVGYVKVIQ